MQLPRDSDLRFAVDLPEDDIVVISNEDRVDQVLVAMLDNAVKYAGDEGVVTLSAKNSEDVWIISVLQYGCYFTGTSPASV